jgi:hypothetical protein
VHEGDYFQTLLTYRRFMLKQGFQMAKAPDSAFGAIWCARNGSGLFIHLLRFRQLVSFLFCR